MASRVNTKFVVILSVALLVVFGGVAAAGWYAVAFRGETLIAKGDALLAEGKAKEAEEAYAKAVNKDPTRVDWMKKWVAVLMEQTPETQVQLEEKYRFYVNVLRKMASLQPTNAEAQAAYLEELNRQMADLRGSREAMQQLADEVTDRVSDLDPQAIETKKLLRFRGQARVQLMSLTQVDQKLRDEALADLKAASAADPTDTDSAISIAVWHMSEVERTRQNGDEVGAQEQLALAKAQIDSMLVTNPVGIDARLGKMLFELNEQTRAAKGPDQERALLVAAGQQTIALVEEALKQDPSAFRTEELTRLYTRVKATAGREGLGRLDALTSKVLEIRPDDFDLRYVHALALKDALKFDEAIAQFDKVIAVPPQKVSQKALRLRGLKTLSVMQQAESALFQAQLADDETVKAASMERARKYRDALKEAVSATQKDLLNLLDARLALYDGKHDEAVALLSELRSSSRMSGSAQRADILGLLASGLEGLKNLGAARQVLEERLQLNPTDPWTLVRLGEVHVQLDEADRAETYYQRAIEIDPSNEQYKARLRSIETARGKGSTDPLIAGIIESRKLRDAKDFAGARAKLEEIQKQFPDEFRVIRERAELEFTDGGREPAIKIIEAAAARAPNDKRYQTLLIQLREEDPVKAAEIIIDSADVTPIEKLLAKVEIYIQHNRVEDAEKAIAEAEKLEPDNKLLIERAFVVAVTRGNLDRARQILAKAAQLNADQVNGLMYKGRLEIVEGKYAEATSTFTQIVEKIPHMPVAWRFKGQSELMNGRIVESVESFRKALDGKPNDVETVRSYANALNRLGRCAEALRVVNPDTGGLKFAPNDEQLIKLWLDLEGRCGDKDRAITRRTEFFFAFPDDKENLVALVRLLMDRNEWVKVNNAIKLYDEREGKDPLLVVLLKADTMSRQNKLPDAIEMFKTYLAGIPKDKLTSRDQLSFAQFLVDNGLLEEGFAAARQARDVQDPKVLEADRRTGDYAFEAGTQALQRYENMMARIKEESISAESHSAATVEAEALKRKADDFFEQSIAAYTAVIKAEAAKEPEQLVQKRLAETYMRLKKWDDADRVLKAVSDVRPDDLQVLLLQSQIQESKGDRRAARQLLDKAVTLFPTDALPFLRRASFNFDDSTLFGDVSADLEQVIRLEPSNLGAWKMRYDLYQARGEEDAALAQLRKGVEANPGNDQLRLYLIQRLMQKKRFDEAQAEAIAAAKDRPEDERWTNAAADLLLSASRFCEAGELYELLYSRRETWLIAGRLLDSTLQCSRKPAKSRVRELLAKYLEGANQKDPGVLMLHCRALWYMDQNKESIEKAREAFKICGQDSICLQRWFGQIVTITASFSEAEQVIRELGKVETLPDYLQVMLMAVEMGDLRTTDERVQEMLKTCDELVSKEGQDRITKFQAHALKSRAHYRLRDVDASIASAEEALKNNPNDLEMNNNLAYMLANDKLDAQKALPFAERAANLAPRASSVLDTLGWVYYKLGRYKEAADILNRAVLTATSDKPDEALVAHVHYGRTQLKLGDRNAAREALDKANSLARQSPEAGLRYRKDIDALVNEMNQ